MKVKASVKKRGPNDQIVRRKGKLYVINKKKPKTQTEARLSLARISGIDIPREKRVIASLRYIHGVGAKRAEDICNDLEINPDTRVNNLTNDEVAKIRKYIESNFRVEGDLRRDVSQNIRRKTEIGTYQGMRHRTGLPVRGQRTHTNARTRKGPRFAIAGKKKVMK